MTKPITPRVHGLIDYGFLLGNVAAPMMLGMSKTARILFASFGVIQGGLNAFTVQPYAVRKMVPFALHGLIEKGSSPVYALAPLLTGVAKEPKARAYWIAMGIALVAVYNLTDWEAANPAK
ncbi:MAG: hypothetical protein JWP30_1935 [Homoserinimonas sp.]|nr:hypothetical protein [Homoserinimonas sp.]